MAKPQQGVHALTSKCATTSVCSLETRLAVTTPAGICLELHEAEIYRESGDTAQSISKWDVTAEETYTRARRENREDCKTTANANPRLFSSLSVCVCVCAVGIPLTQITDTSYIAHFFLLKQDLVSEGPPSHFCAVTATMPTTQYGQPSACLLAC